MTDPRRPFLILGAGMMGKAIGFDLIRSSQKFTVTLADLDEEHARSLAASIDPTRIIAEKIDVQNFRDVVSLMSRHAVTISAVPYYFNYELTKAALEARCHFCDLGHDDEIVAKQYGEREAARAAGICVIANCGLAPGLADILAMHAFRQLDSVEDIRIRVGGLPQHPQPPLHYQLVFSVEGLIEEYTAKAKIIRDGRIQFMEPLTEIEDLVFPPPFTSLEAFQTGGGTSRLPELLIGKVKSLDYKTIRYKGHCEKMRTLLDLGFAGNDPVTVGGHIATSRELFLELLKKRLTFNDIDVVLVLVNVRGTKHGQPHSIRFRVIDYFDKLTGITAMMRTTSFPTSIIAQMMYGGIIRDPGVFTAEEIVPAVPFIQELARRNIRIIEEQ